MATVSILIPAFNPEYLGRALLSAQRQTFEDIEILVGDDTADGTLAEIVARTGDPRVRYLHHGFQGGRHNTQRLWAQAEGKYVKWLFDDDLLMPESVQVLVNALEAHPQSALAFHQRVLIDEHDAVIETPPALLKSGECALISRDLLAKDLVASLNNFIGEPTNALLRRRGIDADKAACYRSLQLDFLDDVGLYLNLSEHAPLVAVGGYYSAKRWRAARSSPTSNPFFSAGCYEWEVFVRGEAAAGNLGPAELVTASQRLRSLYAQYGAHLPELARLSANLSELTQRAPHELFDSPQFRADLEFAQAAVAQRAGRGPDDASTSTSVVSPAAAAAPTADAPAADAKSNVCVVCEQAVERWTQHPEPVDRDFASAIGSVASTFERYLCPHCGCGDGDRHLWLYLAYSGLLEQAATMRILHIAPEPRIEQRIRRLGPLEYVTGGSAPHDASHRVIDAQALDFPNDHFDLIICNHILERVDQPERALAEFHRCLKADGHLVAQTAYSPRLKRTFELNDKPSVPFATRYFGQDGRVRLFGSDIVDRFLEAGFSGDLLPHARVLGDIDPDQVGCNGNEPFFFFAKSAPKTQGAGVPAVVSQSSAAAANPLASKAIRLVCATRCSRERFFTDTALGRSLAVQRFLQAPELQLFENNATGLAALYNTAIEQAAAQPAILVFIHDDVSLTDNFWTERIREGLARFDVVGLAGNKRRSPQQPSWAFSGPEMKWDAPEYLSGSVGHGKGFPCDQVTYFGPSGVPCKLLDGLMLVADSERLVQAGVRFDTRFDFHFYDLDFCRQAESKGLTMGTWPISVVHESGGNFGSGAWRTAYEAYLRKYGE
jgi:SAM-dependent methyltransferase/GT2 family glycosyltransferase